MSDSLYFSMCKLKYRQILTCKFASEKFFYRAFGSIVVLILLSAEVYSQDTINLPKLSSIISKSPTFIPVTMKGLALHATDPFLFDFIIHPGDEKLKDEALRKEFTKSIKDFLAALTVPAEEMGVNLSPYEKNRIIPDHFGKTEMGRNLLPQDYLLKQFSASLTYPDKELGADFWD